MDEGRVLHVTVLVFGLVRACGRRVGGGRAARIDAAFNLTIN